MNDPDDTAAGHAHAHDHDHDHDPDHQQDHQHDHQYDHDHNRPRPQTPPLTLFSSGVLDSPSTSASASTSTPTSVFRPYDSMTALDAPSPPTRKCSVRAPIVQLQTHIPQAHKSGDDPSTPLDTPGRKRTTFDLATTEYNPLTTLSRLFTDSTSIGNSRAPSYSHATGPLYVRSAEQVPLPSHLYTRGLLEGRHSDITVIAFGKSYNLHRLLLDRAPFFTTALSEPWIESRAKEVKLYPDQIDPTITQSAFELAIKKIYGVDISHEIDADAVALFATGCWLEMQDLVDSAIESILRQMVPEKLALLIRLVTLNYYGRSGERILESAKAMLSRTGWEMPLHDWDDMPGDIIRELIGSDGFFVDSEWDRWVLAKRLLDRRLRQAAVDAGLMQHGQKPAPKAPRSLRLMALRFDGVYRQNASMTAPVSSDAHAEWLALYTNPDIERILVLLDEGIHYIHMEYEQLEFIRTARDVFGLPVMPERVVSNALWQQLALRQSVLNANENELELGLCKTPQDPEKADDSADFQAKAKGKARKTIETEAEAESEAESDSEIESDSWDCNGKPRKFWIPSSDCNIVLGNGADPVVTTSNSFQRYATRLSATMQPEDAQWATDFASTPSTLAHPNTRMDYPQRPLSAGGSNAGQPRSLSYTEFPPFRFAVEFPNPRFLKEKKRVYSRTVSYAGSLWNIYIQKVRSAKSVQLGVYLHRAKDRETDEPNPEKSADARRDRRRLHPPLTADVDDDSSGSGDGSLFSASASLPRRRSLAIPHIPHFPSVSSTSPALHSAALDFSSSDSSMTPPPPNPAPHRPRRAAPTLPPYVDARPTIKTYFKIYSPSKGGRMLSIYESAPDQFDFSQSWGWKSSTLMLDETAMGESRSGGSSVDGSVGGGLGPGGVVTKKGDGKLRFMVVIGNL
jgi:hypothetical protein